MMLFVQLVSGQKFVSACFSGKNINRVCTIGVNAYICLKILELSERFPKTTKANIINYQLTKSGTSMYANYRAALRGRSKPEFFSKLSITVEEADETEMWLDLCIT